MKILIFTTLLYINSFAWFNYSIGTNTSVINGTSKEIVYSGGKTLSELIWRLPNVYLAGMDVQLGVYNWIYINYSLKSNILKQQSTMDDYDWMSSTTSDWTHHSNHPNTTLNSVLMQDLSVDLKSLSIAKMQFYISYGLKDNYFGWYSKGGTYIYSNSDGSNFREYKGSFSPNSLGITYQQKFYSTYAALILYYKMDNLNLKTKYGFSLSSDVNDIDIHHVRSLQFEENFTTNTLSFIDMQLDYKYNSEISLLLNADIINYGLMVGNIMMVDMSKGTTTYYSNSAGISHTSYKLGLGINYKFN